MERLLISADKKLPSETESKAKKAKTRKYDDKYLEYGFTQTSDRGDSRPQCVIRGEVSAKESLKPSKMLRHLTTKHESLQSKPLEFFQRKLQELRGQKSILQKAATASFIISHWIAKPGKPHNLGETFFLPCAKETVSVMCGQSAADQLALIPVSNVTSTDIAGEAQLLVYVRFVDEGEIKEDFLFCHPHERATSEQLFTTLDSFVREHEIEWKKCVGICSDGVRAMTGKHSGLVTKVQAVAPFAVWTHCMIHKQALAAKKMPPDMKQVMDEAIRAVNKIKTSATSTRLFKVLCQEMGAKHQQLLFHSEVRWLSRGKVLSRLHELREEVRIFLLEKNSPLSPRFSDEKWLALLAYLANIFSRLNDLNTGLQGKNTSLFTLSDKIEGWIRKLSLWRTRLNNDNFDAFPLLDDFLNESTVPKASLRQVIGDRLSEMEMQFREYFPENQAMSATEEWIRNPFTETSQTGMPIELEESLIDMATDTGLKQRFVEKPLVDFWISVHAEYRELSDMALKKLLPFASTYLCETGFSALVYIKNKYRARLVVEDSLHLFLSPIQPRLERLASSVQSQPSH
ncbi:hypothetical protein QQF64_003279 [Cirrhinus molitorella]|uniref:Transposase n=1 Tax=Cirrhinus molitorella TaxID=172907 RepID=A0ABR3MJK2_9TELE